MKPRPTVSGVGAADGSDDALADGATDGDGAQTARASLAPRVAADDGETQDEERREPETRGRHGTSWRGQR